MIIGAVIMFLGILLGIATETYFIPLLIFLVGIIFVLVMGLRPMLTDEHTIFLVAAIIVSFPATVAYHESVHYIVGSLIWPGCMSLQINFMNGITTANVTADMVESVNNFALWFFYASAPLACVVTACLLIFVPLKKYRTIGGLPNIFKYVLVFAVVMLSFNLFALFPEGSSDLGQANRVLVDAGAPETLSTILHFAIFFVTIVLIAVVGARILWKKKVL